MADKKEIMLLPIDENRNLEKFLVDLAEAKQITDNIKKSYSDMTDTLKKFMAEKGFKKLETDDIAVTYKDAGTRESFDVKLFRADYPDLYDEYTSISETSDSLLIKVKKGDEVK